MKTRLLKRLRKRTHRCMYIYVRLGGHKYGNYEFVVTHNNRLFWNIFKTLEEAKDYLKEVRRKWILEQVDNIRIERENKQLRKL